MNEQNFIQPNHLFTDTHTLHYDRFHRLQDLRHFIANAVAKLMCGGVHTGVILQGRAPTAVRKYDVVNNSLLVCSKLKRSELVRCASREDWRRIHELSSSGRLLHAPPQYLFSHVYNTINLTEATAVPTHLDNLHLSQYGQHMPMKVESYWYIDDGYTTGCNEINCLPVFVNKLAKNGGTSMLNLQVTWTRCHEAWGALGYTHIIGECRAVRPTNV